MATVGLAIELGMVYSTNTSELISWLTFNVGEIHLAANNVRTENFNVLLLHLLSQLRQLLQLGDIE